MTEFPIELTKHNGKFKVEEMFNHLRPEWVNPFVEEYLNQYEGDSSFLLNMKAKSLVDLSSAMIAGVLNWARNDAKKATSTNVSDLVQKTDKLSLDEINIELEHLQLLIDEQKKANFVPQLEELISTLHKDEETLMKEFEAKILEMRQRRVAAQNEIQKFQTSLTEYENKIKALTLSKADALKAQAAQEKIEALTKSLKELRESMPWDDKIRNYQWEDVCFVTAQFIEGKKGVLNALPTGGGKTMEARAFIDMATEMFIKEHSRRPLVLLLTKKALTTTSFKELKSWNPEALTVRLDSHLNQRQRDFSVEIAVQSNALVIANYEMLNTTPMLSAIKWDIVVMDEVQKLKGGANPSGPTGIWSKTFELFWEKKPLPNYTGKKKDQQYEYIDTGAFCFPLTASPVENHPRDLWSFLHIFDPVRFPTVKRFMDEFCYGYGMKDENGNPLVKISWDNLVQKALAGRVISRDKREINPELPDKTRRFIFVEMEGAQLEFYNQLRDSFWAYLDSQKTVSLTIDNLMAQLIYLSEAALLPRMVRKVDKETGKVFHSEVEESAKLDEALDLIEQLYMEGEQIVLFSTRFNEPLFEIERRLAKIGITSVETITGKDADNLEPIEARFQSQETRVLLCNLKSAGEGLNLQKYPERWKGGAAHAIYLDLWWNPKKNEQGEDRIWRQGQSDPVTIHIIQAESSVDAFIADILEKKEEMISGIMDREEIRTGEAWKSYLEGLI